MQIDRFMMPKKKARTGLFGVKGKGSLMRKKGLLVFIVLYAFWVANGKGGAVRAEENVQHNVRIPLVRCAIGNDMAGIFAPEIDVKDIQAAWDLWYEEIATELRISPKNFFYYDVNLLVKDFNDGKLDMIRTTALNYLRMTPAIAGNMDSDIYGVVQGGTKMDRYLLLVRSDAGFAHVRDLKNTALILKKEDDIGRFYLDTLLLKNNQTEADQFFLAINETSSFSKAILSLFFKKGHACIATEVVFNTMVELNPQVGRQIKILHTSPEIVNGVFFFHKDFAPKAKEITLNEMLNLRERVYGQQILILYKIDRLIQLDISDLDPMKALLKEYEELKQKTLISR